MVAKIVALRPLNPYLRKDVMAYAEFTGHSARRAKISLETMIKEGTPLHMVKLTPPDGFFNPCFRYANPRYMRLDS